MGKSKATCGVSGVVSVFATDDKLIVIVSILVCESCCTGLCAVSSVVGGISGVDRIVVTGVMLFGIARLWCPFIYDCCVDWWCGS